MTAVPGPFHAHTEGSGLLTQHKSPEEESRETSNTGGLRGNCHGLVSRVSDVDLSCDGPSMVWLRMATGDPLPSPMVLLD